ncbi:MAG: protease pro-enzyme activation domain-containing protein [Verrucomicrobiota bacterium]|jgi:uncharacterized repeat protein (TIGR01451 family)
MISLRGLNRSLVLAAVFLTGLMAGRARAAPRQLLAGHRPAAAAQAQPVGRLPGELRLNLAVGLPLRNRQELADLLDQLYDPASPSYRQWLTVEQFTERFGPTEQDYRAVLAFLGAQGLEITATFPNRMLIDVAGTVAQIERAFHVALRLYPHPAEARSYYAPDAEPALELAAPLLHISGLDNYILPRPASLRVRPPDQASGGSPCGGSGPSGSYLGKDFRAAYVPNVSLTGAGQFVGLLEFDGYYASDIAGYVSRAGLLTNPPLQIVLMDRFSGLPGSGNAEPAMDIELVTSMAPGLSGIIVYEGTLADDLLGRMATDNVAKQLSGSWTFASDSTTSQIFQQFAAQGQSYFNASGDSGAYVGGVSSPADNPYITIVGGTTLTTTGPVGSWVSETTWNWYSTGNGPGASSGGVSTSVAIPPWQQGIYMAINRGSRTMRNLPDVAMVADDVFVIADNGRQETVGGTSVGAPLWAGLIALVNQQAAAARQPSVGFINPAVYALGKSSSYTNVFHDIKTGNNTNPSSPNLYYAVAGYDLTTGWGSPAGTNLINALAPPPNARVVTLAGATLALETCTPTNGTIDPGETVVVNVSLQNVGGVNTTNLVGTLLSSAEVFAPSGPQTYGALAASGAAVTRPFFFTASGPCGGAINPVIQLQDGSADLGTVSFSFPLGAPVNGFTQTFDGVAAPALPDGWTTAASGAGTNWVTSRTIRDTAPNAAFIASTASPGVSELISPLIPIATATAQLTFRNWYNMESDTASSVNAYDGGVLEIAIGDGPFIDILDAGGSFVTGGYTRTIDPTDDNPLDGRQVWSGLSGTFITTTLNLPASAADQNIQLKWRLGMDTGNDFGASSWAIDGVVIQDGFTCCSPAVGADLAIAQNPLSNPAIVGQDLYYLLSVTNSGPAPASNVTLTDTLPNNATFLAASPGCVNLDGTVVCDLGLLLNGGNTNLFILVSPNAEGLLTNIIVVASSALDTNPLNNTTTLITPAYAPPAISVGPTNQVAPPQADVSFAVAASGTAPLSYQWTFWGTNLPGATAAVLWLTNLQASQAGSYAVVVSNLVGSITSDPASLKIAAPPAISFPNLPFGSASVSLLLNSVTGLNYTLEYKDSLLQTQWLELLPAVPGSGGPLLLQDTNPPALPARFYRVHCQ